MRRNPACPPPCCRSLPHCTGVSLPLPGGALSTHRRPTKLPLWGRLNPLPPPPAGVSYLKRVRAAACRSHSRHVEAPASLLEAPDESCARTWHRAAAAPPAAAPGGAAARCGTAGRSAHPRRAAGANTPASPCLLAARADASLNSAHITYLATLCALLVPPARAIYLCALCVTVLKDTKLVILASHFWHLVVFRPGNPLGGG